MLHWRMASLVSISLSTGCAFAGVLGCVSVWFMPMIFHIGMASVHTVKGPFFCLSRPLNLIAF
jgi:hypothetical protein